MTVSQLWASWSTTRLSSSFWSPELRVHLANTWHNCVWRLAWSGCGDWSTKLHAFQFTVLRRKPSLDVMLNRLSYLRLPSLPLSPSSLVPSWFFYLIAMRQRIISLKRLWPHIFLVKRYISRKATFSISTCTVLNNLLCYACPLRISGLFRFSPLSTDFPGIMN